LDQHQVWINLGAYDSDYLPFRALRDEASGADFSKELFKVGLFLPKLYKIANF